jgi:hypothetical protein
MDSKRTTEVADVAEREAAPVRTPATAYPFLTRREIAARIDADPAFAAKCALVLESRTQQRAAGAAPVGKPWGWMSSERVTAGRLVVKLRGGSLTDGDRDMLVGFVRRYSRQLADHSRDLAIKENPDLSAVAAKFGALPADSAPPILVQTQPEPKETAEQYPTDDGRHPDEVECARDDDELPPRIVAHIKLAPGERTEEIAKALDVTTAMLAPALRMLVQGRQIKKQGVGRGTRYFTR